MADLLTQDAFSELVQQHALWLSTQGAEGKRANFRGADMREIVFRNVDLRDANLRGCNLQNCDLQTVVLDNADMVESDLAYANMTGTSCVATNFSRANLQNAYLNKIQASEAIFQQADCTRLDARNAQMTGVNMRNADLSFANFSFSQLSHAVLRSARAEETIFTHTDLSHSDCNETRFIGTTFIDTVLEGTNMRRAEFIDVSFGDSDFSSCEHLDPSLFTQSASQTKQSLKSEIDTLQNLRDAIERQSQEIDAEKSDLVKAHTRLKSLWRAETQFNEGLSRHVKGLQRFAVLCSASAVAILVFALYISASVGFKAYVEQYGVEVNALIGCTILLFLGAGIQLYRLSSLTVRHLHDKSALLGLQPPEEAETSEEVLPVKAEPTNTRQEEGKIEYF